MPNNFNKYPYTNMHEMNLDWVIMKMNETVEEVKQNKIAADEAIASIRDYASRLSGVEGAVSACQSAINDIESELSTARSSIIRLDGEVNEAMSTARGAVDSAETATNKATTAQLTAEEALNLAQHKPDLIKLYYDGEHIKDGSSIVDFETVFRMIEEYNPLLLYDFNGWFYTLGTAAPSNITFSHDHIEDNIIIHKQIKFTATDGIILKTIRKESENIIDYIESTGTLKHAGATISITQALTLLENNPEMVIHSDSFIYSRVTYGSSSSATFMYAFGSTIYYLSISSSGVTTYSHSFADVKPNLLDDAFIAWEHGYYDAGVRHPSASEDLYSDIINVHGGGLYDLKLLFLNLPANLFSKEGWYSITQYDANNNYIGEIHGKPRLSPSVSEKVRLDFETHHVIISITTFGYQMNVRLSESSEEFGWLNPEDWP